MVGAFRSRVGAGHWCPWTEQGQLHPASPLTPASCPVALGVHVAGTLAGVRSQAGRWSEGTPGAVASALKPQAEGQAREGSGCSPVTQFPSRRARLTSSPGP